jgi:hypothetical protein
LVTATVRCSTADHLAAVAAAEGDGDAYQATCTADHPAAVAQVLLARSRLLCPAQLLINLLLMLLLLLPMFRWCW